MKLNFINILFFSFCFILEFNGCKKDTLVTSTPKPQPIPCDTCLPAITTSGKNTFGCRVNGKVWLPVQGGGNPGQWAEYFNQHLIVHGYNDDKVEWINIELGPITDTGYFSFSYYSLKTQWSNYIIYNKVQNIYFEADTIKTGYFHLLNYDPSKGIFSGTFAFDLYDIYLQHNNDTIHIIDGRFDLHL